MPVIKNKQKKKKPVIRKEMQGENTFSNGDQLIDRVVLDFLLINFLKN